MSSRMGTPTIRRSAWTVCFLLVFVSACFLSGTQPPSLELDPSWHAAIEYAAIHHLQFGTQIVFTFGPLGFLSTRTSSGHLVGARIAFAFFWGALVALAATALAKRLPGWVRYAFLAWLVVFTLSAGLDQTAFFVMAYGTLLLLADRPEERWQSPLFVFAFVVLSLIKDVFITATLGSLALVTVCWIRRGKLRKAIALALAAPAGFVAFWAALGQSPFHLGPWFRAALDLESGYSAAMSLVPKAPVLGAALAALALFVVAVVAMTLGAPRGLLTWGMVVTLAQYAFFAWKEGFTRSGDWHTFILLWFLPLGIVFCFLASRPSAPKVLRPWVLDVTLAASMVLCLAAANLQIPGFAWQQFANWPRRVFHNSKMVVAVLEGRADGLYADCRNSQHDHMLILDHAKAVIGNQSVDVMNYLLLAAVVNGMSYQPRPVMQGFVAYTPALQTLNELYFESARRPHFVMLCQQATDGRFPTLEDSAALNYVLNNYIPVARDGRFLILQQRTADGPVFQLVHQQTLRFGETLDLRPWGMGPLFMSVDISPSLLGRAVTILYQQHPLYMRVAGGQREEQYRIVPSMAQRPFLLSPLLNSNSDILDLYTLRPSRELSRVTFERPQDRAFEFRDRLTVRLYTAAPFLRAAVGIPASRLRADVQDRIFWPEPESVESAAPARVMIYHGYSALAVRAPSKIAMGVPGSATSFSGYFGVPEEAYTSGGKAPGVEFSISVQNRSGESRVAFDRVLEPSTRADDRGRFSFRIPIDSVEDRAITLTTSVGDSGHAEDLWSVWSHCRFEVRRPQ